MLYCIYVGSSIHCNYYRGKSNMLWDIILVAILTIASLTLYQWGATLWKGNTIPADEVKWLSVFLWISAANFIFDAINMVLKFFNISVS